MQPAGDQCLYPYDQCRLNVGGGFTRRSHTAPGWFVIADAATVVLAAVGVLFALATVRPRRWLPVWLVRCLLWPLATLMVLRAVLSIPGDLSQLATGTGASTRTALWDLVLWSPLFLIWGLLWAATGLTYARRVKLASQLRRK
jgi:ABC-type Fe3+ transport system permease subunit